MTDDQDDRPRPMSSRQVDEESFFEDHTIDLDGSEEIGDSDAPSDPPPPPVEPRYRVVGSLGQGGMAVVDLAIDTRLDRRVAIKRLRRRLSDLPEARQRFYSEARILAGLDHPGAIPVFDAGTLPDGDHFYAMKRVKGRTLREVLRERTPEELRDIRVKAGLTEIFLKVCQTVAAAHRQGVIHRDIKPENIMVDELGVVYVMDWGLAKRLEEEPGGTDAADSRRTRMGAVLGTPAYMAPELARGQGLDADRQADVFSLGIVLYEILTGINPFLGENPMESMKGVVAHDPDPPVRLQPHVSRVLSAICMKALQKDPFRRYPSAVELADDVQRYQEYREVSAYTLRPIDRLVNWSRRRPRAAAIAVTLAVILVIAGLGVGLRISAERTMVSNAFGRIENIDLRLARLRGESGEIKAELASGSLDKAEVEIKSRRLVLLRARREVAQEARMAVAMAITGFTIFSPDERALDIVRDSLLNGIRNRIEAGDLEEAAARIELALDFSEGRNLFGFSREEIGNLEEELKKLRAEIDGGAGILRGERSGTSTAPAGDDQ